MRILSANSPILLCSDTLPLLELLNLPGFVLSALDRDPNPSEVAMSLLDFTSLMSSHMDSSLCLGHVLPASLMDFCEWSKVTNLFMTGNLGHKLGTSLNA